MKSNSITKILLSITILCFVSLSVSAQSKWSIKLNDENETLTAKLEKDGSLVFKFSPKTDFLNFEQSNPENIKSILIVRSVTSGEQLWESTLISTDAIPPKLHMGRIYFLLDEKYKDSEEKFELIETWGDGEEQKLITFEFEVK